MTRTFDVHDTSMGLLQLAELAKDGNEIILGQRIIPTRIQVRSLLRREAHTVTKMMIEDPWQKVI